MSARTIHLEPENDYLGHYLTACGVEDAGDDEGLTEYAVTDDPLAVTCGNCRRTRDFRRALETEAEQMAELSRCAERDPGAIG